MSKEALRKTQIIIDVVAKSKPLQQMNKQVDDLVKKSKGANKTVDGTTKALDDQSKATDHARKAINHVNKSNGILVKTYSNVNKQVEQATKVTQKANKAYSASGKEVQGMNKALESTQKVTKNTSKHINSVQKSTGQLAKASGMASSTVQKLNKDYALQNRTIKDNQKIVKLMPKGYTDFAKSTQRATKDVKGLNNNLIDASKRFKNTSRTMADYDVNMSKIRRGMGSNITTFKMTSDAMGDVIRRYHSTSGAAAKMTKAATQSGWEVGRSMTTAAERSGFFAHKFASTRDSFTRGMSNIASQTSRQVSSINNTFRSIPTTFGPIATSIGNNVASGIIAPFKSATNVVAGFGATMGLLSAGALVNSGLDRLSSIENSTISLEVMMGGREEAESFMDEILDFAKTTPYAFDKLSETSRNLYAFGMDREKIVPAMKAIGDAASASGKGAAGLDQIASAFGDMQVAGTLSLDQINRLQTAGVPALKILSNTAGVSTDEMRKQISSGTLSSVKAIDDLVKGMQEGTDGVAGATAGMAGIMEKTKDTWTGSLDSMKSAVRSTMANLMTPLKPHLQEAMSVFANAFSSLPEVFSLIGSFIQPAIEPLKLAFSDIKSFIVTALIPTLKMLGEVLEPSVRMIGGALVGALILLGKILNEVIGPILRFVAGIDGLVPILAGVVAGFVAYHGIILAVAGAKKVLAATTVATQFVIQTFFAALSAGNAIMTAFRAIVLRQATAQKMLNAAMIANPLVLLVAALAGLAIGFYTAYKRSETFRNAVDATFATISAFVKGIPSALSTAWDSTKSFFANMGQNIALAFADGFVPGLKKIGPAVYTGGAEIAASIGAGIGYGLRNTGVFFSSLGESLKVGMENSISYVSNSFSSVGETITEKISLGMGNRAGEIARNFFSQLATGFSSVSGIASLLAPTMTTIGLSLMGVSGPIGLIVGGIVSVISYLFRLAQTNEEVAAGFANVFSGIAEIFQSVMTALAPVGEAFSKLGNRMYKELSSQLAPEFAKTFETISQSVEQLQPVFAEVGASFGELGSAFIGMFIELLPVIQQMGSLYVEFQMTLWSSVGEIVSEILPMLVTAFTSLLPIITEVFSTITTIVATLVPIIGSLIAELVPVILQIVLTVLPMFLDVFMQVIPAVMTIVTTLVPVIINVLSTIISVVLEIVSTVLPLLLNIVQMVFPIILSIVQTVIPIVADLLILVINIVLDLVQQVLPVMLAVVEAVFPVVASIIEAALKVALVIIKVLMAILINVLVPAIKAVLAVVQFVFPIIAHVIESALNVVIGIVNFFTALFQGDLSGMWDAVKSLFSNSINYVVGLVRLLFIDKIIGAIIDFVQYYWSLTKQLWSYVGSAFSDGINAAIQFILNMIATIIEKWTLFKTSILTIASGLWTSIKNYFSSGVTNAIQFIVDMKDGIVKKWGEIKSEVTVLAKALWEIVEGRFNDMVEGAKALPGKIAEGIKSMGHHAITGVVDLGNAMIKGLGDVVNGVIDGINTVLEKLGVSSSIPNWSVPSIPVPAYAKGTESHPGGPAILGDGGGSELYRTPSGYTGLSPATDTMMNLPKGTQVLSHTDTQRYFNNVPMYSSGTANQSLFGQLKGVGANVWEATKSTAGKVKNVATDAWDTGKKVAGSIKDKAVDVWEMVTDPSKILSTILSSLGIELPDLSGAFGNMAGGLFNKIKEGALSYITGQTADLGFGGEGGSWGHPFRMTSPFGMRTHPITGARSMHTGVDWAAPMGTPIPAQAGGKVSFAGVAGGYGNLVKIVSGIFERYYAHNQKNLVSAGDTVSAGQTIGLTGSTGQSTGPHVHYEVRKNGTPIDPNSVQSGTGGGASGTVKQWIMSAIEATGVPKSWVNALSTIAQKESGGNPKAINNWDINAKRGIPSKGLMQTIGPTFNAYKQKGMNDIYNPVHNAAAAINYIKSRYGTVFNTPGIKSMQTGGAYRGYFQGGRLIGNQHAIVGEQGPELMKLHGGAQIYNARKTQQMISSRQGLNESDNGSTTITSEADGSNVNISFNPTINIKIDGGDSSSTTSNIKKAVKEVLEETLEDLRNLYAPEEEY